jgi:hypothetical protein
VVGRWKHHNHLGCGEDGGREGQQRVERGWWVGEEWCPCDPKVSAVPRGKDSREGKKRESRGEEGKA